MPSETSQKISLGIIGLGKMGGFHFKIASSLSGFKLVGVADPNEACLAPLAENRRLKKFTDYKELLPFVDAVIIAAATPFHYQIGKDCLQAGKHLLIEKPLCQNTEEAEELVALAKEKQLVLAVGHIERFNPAFIAIQKLIKNKLPLMVEFFRSSPFVERMKDTSCVIDMTIHDLDLASALAHSPVKTIEAKGKIVKSNTLDQVKCKIFFENGFVANIQTSRLTEEKERKIILHLEEFILEIDLQNKKLVKKQLPHPEKSLTELKAFHETEEILVEPADQLTLEQKDFLKSIRHSQKPKVSGEDGLVALQMAEAIEKQAKC